jgi:predicted amidohydrolase
MKPLKVASVQMNALKDDFNHNLDVHIKFIQKAAKKKCQLIMYSEVLSKGQVSLRDHMIVADLNPKAIDKARLDPGYNLKYRRPEVYKELTRMI